MTLKEMMLGSAIAALVAGGAVAQTADAPVAGSSDSETSTEAPVVDPQSSTDTETDTEVDTDTGMAAESDTETDTDTGMTTESEIETDTDTGMAADSEAAPDAGATMAPEAGMAAEGDDAMGDTAMAEGPTSLSAMTVDEVVGTSVIGIDDQNVGDVDYVIEQSDGLAFVVGVGGFLGLGEYTVAVPADQFTLNADGDLALSSMTQEELESMPEFTEEGVEGLDGELVIGDLMGS